jgi:hypothetical protein
MIQMYVSLVAAWWDPILPVACPKKKKVILLKKNS